MLNPNLEQGRARLSLSHLFLLLAVSCWLFLFQDALLSALRIWYISEIFTHGFFIMPGAVYLIWRERENLRVLSPKPNYWVLLLLIPALILGTVGVVGGIQVFSHISAFTVLPLSIWLCMGNRMAKVIWFPLCFMLFSIPVGEELVPYLQKITADIAVILLGWANIPIYVTGLYIQIPQGNFVVAEACSGIRFFVGSLVFGAIYSHLSYLSFSRKVAFMLLSAVVPIIANAIRVFGIVLIGYYSDMKYAVGADHLVYGWVFFVIVLFLLTLVGETFRQKVPLAPRFNKQDLNLLLISPPTLNLMRTPLILLLTLLVINGVWQNGVALDPEPTTTRVDREQLAAIATESRTTSGWHPVLSGTSDLFVADLLDGDQFDGELAEVDLTVAWYAENRDGAELISSTNRLYDIQVWSSLGADEIQIDADDQQWSARVLRITSSSGRQRLILYWYQLPDRIEVSAIKTKLYQTLDVLFGGKGAGALVVFSLPYADNNYATVRERLIQSATEYGSKVREALPF